MQSWKVLIVEDNPSLYDELCVFFEKKEFEIIKLPNKKAVANYEEAIKLVTTHQPDIVILDIELQGRKDGIDIGAFIKRNYHIPIIFLSGYSTTENRNRIRKIGTDQFVVKVGKPVNLEQLETSVDLVLPETRIRIKEKAEGKYFNVRKIQVGKGISKKRSLAENIETTSRLADFFYWKQIIYFESSNKSIFASKNNNILFKVSDPNWMYVMRGSLSELQGELPDFFIRVNRNRVINLMNVPVHLKGQLICYNVDEKEFKISKVYRNQALEQINRFSSHFTK